MKFPLAGGEVLPGADANRLVVIYRTVDNFDALVHEYTRSLERAGYAFDNHGKDHDPPASSYSAIYTKGGDRLLFTVVKDGPINVTIKKMLD